MREGPIPTPLPSMCSSPRLAPFGRERSEERMPGATLSSCDRRQAPTASRRPGVTEGWTRGDQMGNRQSELTIETSCTSTAFSPNTRTELRGSNWPSLAREEHRVARAVVDHRSVREEHRPAVGVRLQRDAAEGGDVQGRKE